MLLDMSCGGKAFYFDKSDPRVIFGDIRNKAYKIPDREIKIKPDAQWDFKKLPFKNEQFKAVVFDPPHLRQAGKNGWQYKKYGVLDKDWESHLRAGFKEGFRVLKTGGVFIFKWCEFSIKLKEILKLTSQKPVLGNRGKFRSKTHWVVFVKEPTWTQ